ncbi:MAG: CCA tRNA nucleotidyltransferase [Roseobacter sp.]|jgi:poly(A) polymerase/tRNA nucleotidyltransferase (CCA-adding enzyme)
MDRSDDITLPVETPWLNDADAQAVCRALQAHGDRVYFVGGCVRDALLGLGGADVDLSTALLPQEVTNLAEEASLKVAPTGIDHGTVTVVSGGKGFEVTTFRRDVETDGRRAVVSFSKDIAEDARRRDFTMNALYATPDGVVVDPLGGVQDCLDRRIRFIENADERIREDFLRILRYFRFHAWYAQPDAGFDAETLAAIAQNTSGLETLSVERIGTEMLKLLSAPDPAPAVAAMRQTGCLQYILPGADDRLLGPVVHLEAQLGASPDPILRLAALGGEAPAERWRLSRANARRLADFVDAGYGETPLSEVAYRKGETVARGAAVLRAALSGGAPSDEELKLFRSAAQARFPVKSADLRPAFEGPALGMKLAELEARWIASDFTLTREELLQEIP